jgi:hypothetical protein
MDGLSSIASVIAVVQISGQLFDICRAYFMAVKEARKDIQRLQNEVSSLQDVLINVSDLADVPGPGALSILTILNQPDGLLQQCQKELMELTRRLDSEYNKNPMRKFGLRALKWPLSSKDIDTALETIRRHKATFNLALTADFTYVSLFP